MRSRFAVPSVAVLVLLFLAAFARTPAQKPKPGERPPRGQDSVPGPPLSPADAVKRMKVPGGFRVECVVSEPDIVNPVAMTFDERGRMWITESLEYPRTSPGKGCDRVKVLDIGADGKVDKGHRLRRGAEHPLRHRRRPRRRLGRQRPRHPLLQDRPRRQGGRQARGRRHGLRPRRHARTAQLAHLGPRRLAVRPQRRLQPQSRPASRQGPPTSPARCSASIRRRANSSSSARARATPGASPSTRGQRLRQRLRHRPSLAPDRDRLLPPPGRPLSALHLEARLHRQAPPSEGRLLRSALLRQRRLSEGISRPALHGQHPRRLHQRGRASPRRQPPISPRRRPTS